MELTLIYLLMELTIRQAPLARLQPLLLISTLQMSRFRPAMQPPLLVPPLPSLRRFKVPLAGRR
jgi:hypothetical protein